MGILSEDFIRDFELVIGICDFQPHIILQSSHGLICYWQKNAHKKEKVLSEAIEELAGRYGGWFNLVDKTEKEKIIYISPYTNPQLCLF